MRVFFKSLTFISLILSKSSSSTARIIALLRSKLKTDNADLLALIVEGITKLYLVKALDDEGVSK